MIDDLIRRARRRLLLNELLKQLAFAGAVAVAGVALILLAGTRFLEWWTLGVFAAAGLVAAFIRLRRAVPSHYAAAVELDQRAHTYDALATAVWFSANPGAGSEVSGFQRAQAEAAAGSVDLEAALPFSLPKTLYAMAALAVFASALLLVRYFSMHTLDLRAPITEVLFEDQAAKQVKAKNNMDPAARKRMQAAEDALSKLGMNNINPDDPRNEEELEKAIEAALNTKDSAAREAMDKGDSKDGQEGASDKQNGDPMDQEKTDSEDENQQNGQNQNANDKGDAKSGKQSEDSMMSKLKDAVSNMFSRDKKDSQQTPQKGQQNQQGGQPEKAQKGDKGDKSDESAQNQGTDRDNEPTEASDKKDAQGKASAKSNADSQSSKGGSGAGSQDGAKDLKAAEQLKAMGKITEIIGKRATTISGDSMVEVQDTDPRARTAYADKTAAHGDADSDVSRDEIPVELQPYVQQYFDQVHKQPAPKPAAPKPAQKN